MKDNVQKLLWSSMGGHHHKTTTHDYSNSSHSDLTSGAMKEDTNALTPPTFSSSKSWSAPSMTLRSMIIHASPARSKTAARAAPESRLTDKGNESWTSFSADDLLSPLPPPPISSLQSSKSWFYLQSGGGGSGNISTFSHPDDSMSSIAPPALRSSKSWFHSSLQNDQNSASSLGIHFTSPKKLLKNFVVKPKLSLSPKQSVNELDPARAEIPWVVADIPSPSSARSGSSSADVGLTSRRWRLDDDDDDDDDMLLSVSKPSQKSVSFLPHAPWTNQNVQWGAEKKAKSTYAASSSSSSHKRLKLKTKPALPSPSSPAVSCMIETNIRAVNKKIASLDSIIERNKFLVKARLQGGNEMATVISMKQLLSHEAQRVQQQAIAADLQQVLLEYCCKSKQLQQQSPNDSVQSGAIFSSYEAKIRAIYSRPAPKCTLQEPDDILREARTRLGADPLLSSITKNQNHHPHHVRDC